MTDFGYDSVGRIISARDPLTNDLIASAAIADGSADSHKAQVAYTLEGMVARAFTRS